MLLLTIFLLIFITPHSNVAALQVLDSLTFTTTHYRPKNNINAKLFFHRGEACIVNCEEIILLE